MKVVRIYDDKKKIYNNVNLATLCSSDISLEYCTFVNRKRSCIVINESNDEVIDGWNFKPDNEYYVFLDTKWEDKLMDEWELILGKLDMPLGLISELGMPCVRNVAVYTAYGKDDGEDLMRFLKGNENLVNKIGNRMLSFEIFQPDNILYDIKQEGEQWGIF